MATCAAQARLLSLTMYKSDLEFKLMGIIAEKQQLTKLANDYSHMYAEMGGSSDAYQDDMYVVALQKQDEALEAEQTILQTQLQEVNTEKEEVKKLVETNIKQDFKINFGS